MTELSVDQAGVAAYATTTAAMSSQVASAAAASIATGPAVLAPVFGLIGTEFLAAFTAVHSAHAAAVGRLATTVASLGSAAAASAGGYDLTDARTATSLL